MKQYKPIYCELNEVNAHEIFNVRKLDYGNGKVEYYIYNYVINRKKKNVELKEVENDIENKHWLVNDKALEKLEQIKKNAKKKETVKDVKETVPYKEITKENLLKSSRRLYQYANANARDFKTFITLTFKENIIDIDVANKKFNTWRTNFSKCCKDLGIDLKYLGVPEFQKRGAVHYHILTNIPIDSELFVEQENKKGYDVLFWKYGFSSVFDLSQTDEYFDVVKYIAKYFFKDMDNRLFGHNKILKSNNLNKPIETIEYINKNMWSILQDKVSDVNSKYEKLDIYKYKETEVIDGKEVINEYDNMIILTQDELPF